MTELLNFIYHRESFTVSDLYGYFPIEKDDKMEKIIYVLLSQTLAIDVSKDHHDMLKAQWLGYRQTVFNKICEFIKSANLDTLTPGDYARSILQMTTILSLGVSAKHSLLGVQRLFIRFFFKKNEAPSQALCTVLCAHITLLNNNITISTNTNFISDLLSCLHSKRAEDFSLCIANDILWAIEKLVEMKILQCFNKDKLTELYSTCSDLIKQANTSQKNNLVSNSIFNQGNKDIASTNASVDNQAKLN